MHNRRVARRRVLPAWAFALAAAVASAAPGPVLPPSAAASAEPAFLIGTEQSNNYYARLFRRVFGEAFRRLGGPPVAIVDYPLPRLTAMLERGEIDAEAARGLVYGATHPEFARVDESFIQARWVLYTARPELRIGGLEDIARLGLEGAWRRGVLACERAMRPLLPGARGLDVTSAAQGLKLVLSGRTDLYCDVDVNVDQTQSDPRLAGATGIAGQGGVRELWVLGYSPLYTFMHPRHAALASRLAQVLRQMKDEGLLDRYRQEALRDMAETR